MDTKKEKRLEFLGKKHKAEILALFMEMPVLEKICDNRDISVIRVERALEIINFSSPCAMGFNYIGWVYGVKRGEIIFEATWKEIRDKQKELNYPDPYDTTARAVLTGDEDMFIFVQEHSKENNLKIKWISVNVYLARERKFFKNYPEIMAWAMQPKIKKQINELF